jgi:hypothetical protein
VKCANLHNSTTRCQRNIPFYIVNYYIKVGLPHPVLFPTAGLRKYGVSLPMDKTGGRGGEPMRESEQ